MGSTFTRDVSYISFKKNNEIIVGIPVSTALGLSALALMVTAWKYLT